MCVCVGLELIHIKHYKAFLGYFSGLNLMGAGRSYLRGTCKKGSVCCLQFPSLSAYG